MSTLIILRFGGSARATCEKMNCQSHTTERVCQEYLRTPLKTYSGRPDDASRRYDYTIPDLSVGVVLSTTTPRSFGLFSLAAILAVSFTTCRMMREVVESGSFF